MAHETLHSVVRSRYDQIKNNTRFIILVQDPTFSIICRQRVHVYYYYYYIEVFQSTGLPSWPQQYWFFQANELHIFYFWGRRFSLLLSFSLCLSVTKTTLNDVVCTINQDPQYETTILAGPQRPGSLYVWSRDDRNCNDRIYDTTSRRRRVVWGFLRKIRLDR